MESFIKFAEKLAQDSGQLIMNYFNQGVEVERKSDKSPVTIADKEAEVMIRGMIEAQFPDHRVEGEEGGVSGKADAKYNWVLDPIDGTKSFISGVPLFGTLIALREGDTSILGVIHLPATGELLIGAKGFPTTLNGKPVRVSETKKLSEATLLYTCKVNMRNTGFGGQFTALEERAQLVRGWGDCYGHFMVATGRADIMFDPNLNLWDVAALRPIIEGAGGRLCGWGDTHPTLGQGALSTNAHLHDEVVNILGDHPAGKAAKG